MTWDVALRDVNAGMPRSVRDMYSYAQPDQALYLIKPFDILAWAQVRLGPAWSRACHSRPGTLTAPPLPLPPPPTSLPLSLPGRRRRTAARQT